MLNLGQINPEGLKNEHILQKLAWQQVNLPQEVENAFLNHTALAFAAGKIDRSEMLSLLAHLTEQDPGRVRCMSECPKGSGPIVLCGSGSSLNTVAKELKDWKGKVICSTSQASTLIYHGRVPDYIVCMDPRVASPDKEMDAPDFGDAVLLAHPSIPHPYVTRWLKRARGTIYLARIMEPSYDWYSHHLGQGYSWVRHIMLPMIDSGAAMMGYATWLGYNPIYLIGIDYGGPRFDRWDFDYATQTWTVDAVTSGFVVKDEGNFGGLTGKEAMNYSSRGSLISAFMQIANETYHQRIYNLSDRSIFTQFPREKWDTIKNWGPGDLHPQWDEKLRQEVLDDIECALAAWNTFLVKVDGAWGVEYHTYIVTDESLYIKTLDNHNAQVASNVANFERIEKAHDRPLSELLEEGTASVEAGDFLMHGADEYDAFDWRKMKPIDIGNCLVRRRWLLEESKKRGYFTVANPRLKEFSDKAIAGLPQGQI